MEMTNADFLVYLYNTIFRAGKEKQKQIENEIMQSITDQGSWEGLKAIFEFANYIRVID